MSFIALNAALSGLRVAQQQLGVISNNVSNATTPGYTRKILPQSTQIVDNTGQIVGVRSDMMIRKVDLNLERELWTQVSSVSALDVKASYLSGIENFHGATNKEFSIAAEIARLKDKFSALSDSPSDGFLLQSTLDQAQQLTKKFNDFGSMITQMRNDVQTDMQSTINRTNDLLQSVAYLNSQIKGSENAGRSTAALADKRDEAIKELADYIEISFFMRGDGVMVVQTKDGTQLADEKAGTIFFKPHPLGASNLYPGNAAGIYVGGNPETTPSAVNITSAQIGGKLGGLIELRDETLVQYQAQVDELAHKLALRMEAQGLRLFTNPAGSVPEDTPPDPSGVPPVSVSYVGFASVIQVNTALLNDPNLVQQGTYNSDKAVPSASNEVIRRIIQFGFGDIDHQEAAGTIDLNITAPATDLQQWLGLRSTNNVVGGINLSSFPQIDDGVAGTSDLISDLADFFPNYPNNAQFQITFEEPRLGLGPVTVTVDLGVAGTNHPVGSPGIDNALDQVIAEINAQITAAGVPADLAAMATSNSNGQLSIRSAGNITLSASGFTDAMGTQAFAALGLAENTYVTEDPYFDIQVGNDAPVRITIEPGDDINDLIAKLEYDPATRTGVPGLHVALDSATGQLTLRPGMADSANGPSFGGDIRIVSGPGQSVGALNPALAGLPQGVGLVSALFGSYTVNGTEVTESSPIRNVLYGSETYAGSGVYTPFRLNHLGANTHLSTNLMSGTNIVDYAQKMINAHGQDISLINMRSDDETTLRDLLQERFLNETGVNIDEELSMLIVVQTAYAAAARAVSAADDMFAELLNVMR